MPPLAASLSPSDSGRWASRCCSLPRPRRALRVVRTPTFTHVCPCVASGKGGEGSHPSPSLEGPNSFGPVPLQAHRRARPGAASPAPPARAHSSLHRLTAPLLHPPHASPPSAWPRPFTKASRPSPPGGLIHLRPPRRAIAGAGVQHWSSGSGVVAQGAGVLGLAEPGACLVQGTAYGSRVSEVA